MALWRDAFAAEGHHEYDHRQPLDFHRLEGHEIDLTTHSTLFSGEQSNSSVAFGDDSLMKVFRRVTPGVNPDIQIHDVLTRAGSDHVAALYGWLDAVDDDSDAIIQLAMLQQFLRTGTDGWDLAQASVRNLFAEGDLHPHEVGGDFAGEASRLGVALAETHAVLAEHFPTEQRGPAELGALADAMTSRLDEALVAVPVLEAYADGLRAAFEAVRGAARRPRPAHARRPAPGPDPAHGQGLEARRLRGRAGQAAGRPAAAGLGLARRRRHAPLVRLRRRGGRPGDERQRCRRCRAARLPGSGVDPAQQRRAAAQLHRRDGS